MEHLLLKAATITAVEEGAFEAVISTASEDRDGDIVEPSALVGALAKWAELGKRVPLAYSHRDPETGQAVVVGYIDPESARVDGNRVITKGWVDQSTERGAETWRLVKSGTLSFSYGYLVPEGGATKRAGKKTGLHITTMDVFEISVVPVGPANNETLVLSWKSAEALREEAKEIAHAVEDSLLPDDPPEEPAEPKVDVLKELQETKAMLAEMGDQIAGLKKKVEETDQETKSRSVDPLQTNAMQTALGVLSGGVKAPKVVKEEPKPQPDQEPEELRKASHDLMVRVLSGAKTD